MKVKQIAALVLTIIGFCTAFPIAAQKNDPAAGRLQEAIHKQVVEGDWKQAIKMYNDILSKYAGNHSVAASALLHLGDAQEKLGIAEARKAWERLLRDYSDQKDLVAEARARLDRSSMDVPPARFVCRDCSGQDGSLTPEGLFAYLGDGGPIVRDIAKGEITRWPAGTGSAPKLSPDGRTIAVVQRNRTLALLPNVSGSTPSTLAPRTAMTGFALHAWSRDGNSLLVTGRKADGTFSLSWVSINDLAVTEIASFGTRPGGAASVSPDGKFVAYATAATEPGVESHIMVMPAQGGPPADITAGSSPIWMPDGTQLVFVRSSATGFDLWAVAIRDGKASKPPFMIQRDLSPSVFSHGITRSGTYYFSTRNEPAGRMYVAEMQDGGTKIRGNAPHILANFEGENGVLSPDGRFVAFAKDYTTTAIYSLETHRVQEFSQSLATQFGASPVWFHDGSAILEKRIDDATQQTWSVYRLDLKSGSRTRVLRAPRSDLMGPMVLAPDNKTLYVPSPDWEVSSGFGLISVFDLNLGQKTGSLRSPGGPAFALSLSHDGRTLGLVVMLGLTQWELGRMATDGTGYETIRRFSKPVPSIPWTQHDESILFAAESDISFLSSTSDRIMRVGFQTGSEPEFTGLDGEGLRNSNPNQRVLSLSDDGSRIAYSRSIPTFMELWSLDLSSMLKGRN